MNAYTELKNSFDHLQKRTLQLFDAGRQRESVLETALANAWKQFGEIAEMDSATDMRERASTAQAYMAEALNNKDR